MLCAAERVWRRMARAPPVASSTAAYALGVRDVTCKLAALRSPDGWPPVHEQHWRGRTTKVRMSGRIAQTIVARHPLPLPENERFTRHPSPLATPLRREGASSTEGGASEARGKGAQTELPGQGLRSRGRLASGWERAAGSQAGRGAAGRGRVGAVAVGRGTRRGRGGRGVGGTGSEWGGVGTQAELPGQGRGGVAGSPGGRMGAHGGVVGRRAERGRATGSDGAGEAPGQRSRRGLRRRRSLGIRRLGTTPLRRRGPHGAPRRRRTRLPAQRERKERASCRNGEADGKTAFRLVTHQPHAAGVCERRRTEIS